MKQKEKIPLRDITFLAQKIICDSFKGSME